MTSEFKLPLEQRSREEAEQTRATWNSGAFNFLMTRTQEKYRLKATRSRRQSLEGQSNCQFPEISDDMLRALYQFACLKYMKKCHRNYGVSSGFSSTPSESAFARTLASIIQNNPSLKHLEVYPSQKNSKDLTPGFKMVVGNYVPDLIIFGLKTDLTSGVAIEIDGDSHIDKWQKDELRNAHLRLLKIFTFEIQNAQVADVTFITKALLKMYRLRNGSFNQQILRAKRLIWTKTISCQLSIEEIEELARDQFSVELNLKKEAQALLTMDSCPRKIRMDLRRMNFNK